MTFCDVSPPESALPEPPAVLVLTHRRGGGVLALAGLPAPAVVQESEFIAWAMALGLPNSGENSLLPRWLFSLQSQCAVSSAEPFQVFCEGRVSLALSRSTTAEHLAAMYCAALSALGLNDSRVSSLAVGSGLGSFTGLRIGCAFGNGLARGRRRALWRVPCPSLATLHAGCAAQGLLESEAAKRDFDTVSRGVDESFAQVSLMDVAIVGHRWLVGQGERVETLIPDYGKEPGPVLKLRAQGEGGHAPSGS